MGSLGNPKPLVPYMNSKDCSQGFCSYYCPQWCYIIFPPPPPVQIFPDDNTGPNFSPLVIAIIGILASAFLLVSYYAIISKYCGNMDSARGRETRESNEELQGNEDDPSTNQEPWNTSAATNTGLDEALIKSITVCKYKKEDGLIEGTDCSVCLSEFQEDESLRLLPKCSHAFHVLCIDKWLKSHSNCPLCRANIVPVNAASSPPSLPLPLPPSPPPPPPPPPVIEPPLSNENEVVVSGDTEMYIGEETLQSTDEVPKTDLGNSEEGDTIIEIGDEDDDDQMKGFDQMEEECQLQGHIGSSKGREVESSKSSRVLHCVMSPVAMKRSFSSGRFSLYCRHGRGRNITIPL